MTRDWARLGSLLKAGRQAGGRTQDELGSAIGVTRNSLATIEAGRATRVTATIRSYAREVGWDDGSVEAVLAGGEPTLRESEPAAAAQPSDLELALARALMKRLPARLLQELSDGHVIDTDIVDLREDGSAAVMALVIERGEEPPAPDQVREDLREWGAVQRDLRRAVTGRQSKVERTDE
ncbi:helix-turn-helix domain-containing protein [Streptomyces sp. NRRL B-24484]|uniref:helix-turn-helix domain-containing protein n=1 Tax=Streptomyces sp. NRRL B-24484 TaxID=1463833 RepID=UPI000B1828ED|nr:helix-turn-helix transcriptional regulator [Streptomyces sp. NRRL B-24484]